MQLKDFFESINLLSKINSKIRLYPYTNQEKLYNRFVGRVYHPYTEKLVTDGWLREIYYSTNGIDFNNYYFVPFNNYFNPKSLPFEEFYIDWIKNQNNIDEIIGHFGAFMTDGKTLIGYLEYLSDSKGNNFIGIAQESPIVNDIIIISSSIYILFDEIVKQLKANGELSFTEDIDYWRSVDPELDTHYKNGNILKYKLRYLYQDESINYKKYTEQAP
jgi:hypothetical protein